MVNVPRLLWPRDSSARRGRTTPQYEARPRTRLPVARRLFAHESSVNETNRVPTPLDFSTPRASPCNRPLRDHPSTPSREEDIERENRTPKIAQLFVNSRFFCAQLFSCPVLWSFTAMMEEQGQALIDISPPAEGLSDEDVHEILDYPGSDDFLDSFIDRNNNVIL